MRAIISPEKSVDARPKNFLTEAEMGNFLKAARRGRHSTRNFAMLLMTFRHGLRVSELINMRIADVDLDTGHLFVRRLKGSLSTSQPLEGGRDSSLTSMAASAYPCAVLQFAAGFCLGAWTNDKASLQLHLRGNR